VGSVGSVQFQIVPCSSLYLFSSFISPLQCLVSVNYRVLICHTSRAVPSSVFILASSVCKSLRCLISALAQGGEGGHLFRLTCSVCWRRQWQPTPVLLPGKFPWTEEPGGLQSMGS